MEKRRSLPEVDYSHSRINRGIHCGFLPSVEQLDICLLIANKTTITIQFI